MVCLSGRSAAWSRGRGVALLLLAAALGGCNSLVDGGTTPAASTGENAGGSSNIISNTVFGAPNTAQKNAIVVNAENFGFDINDCPAVSIKPGTESITTFKPGEKINPELGEKPTVQYQSAIVNTARECTKTATGVQVKVGIKGRVTGGPAAKAGTINMPIRVVVMQGGDKVISSNLYKIPVALQEPDLASDFTKIDDTIVLPIAPGNTDYKIYVGFDEGSVKKGAG